MTVRTSTLTSLADEKDCGSRSMDAPRVVKIDEVSARKLGSVVEVAGPDDVDAELLRWLQQAYQLRLPSGSHLP